MSLDFSLQVVQPVDVYWRNYTHNVTGMWRLAGVYDALYNSEGKKAKSIISSLRKGLDKMVSKKKTDFEKLNPPNNWGSYDGAVTFLSDVLHNCELNPNAIIRISK